MTTIKIPQLVPCTPELVNDTRILDLGPLLRAFIDYDPRVDAAERELDRSVGPRLGPDRSHLADIRRTERRRSNLLDNLRREGHAAGPFRHASTPKETR